MILNSPKTKNMWLLDCTDGNSDMNLLTHKDLSFVPSFRNPLSKTSLAYLRAKNKTQYVYQFSFVSNQISASKPKSLVNDLYIRTVIDGIDVFKNLHKELATKPNNQSKFSSSLEMISSTLSNYKGNVFTNSSDISSNNSSSENNIQFFVDAVTNIDKGFSPVSSQRKELINLFTKSHANKSHAELEAIGYDKLSLFLSNNQVTFGDKTYLGVVHDEDCSFNINYVRKTLYIDFSSGIPEPKFKTEYIMFDVTYYAEDGGVLLTKQFNCTDPFIAYYLASVCNKRSFLSLPTNSYHPFSNALKPLTLKCDNKLIPHVETYYTVEEDEDLKSYEEKIANTTDSFLIREYNTKIKLIEREAKNRNASKKSSFWRWLDMSSYNLDELSYLGDRTIASLKNKNVDLYDAFESLNSKDSKSTNAALFFGSKVASKDPISNLYNYYFFKYIYENTPEYKRGESKRTEFVFGTDGICSSVSFERVEKAVFSDDIKLYYNKRYNRGLNHKILACRVKKKSDGTYGFHKKDDETDMIDDVIGEYVITSYTSFDDIGKFLDYYIDIPVAFVYCNSSNNNTCYVIHKGMSTARAFHYHDDSSLSKTSIEAASTPLDVRCKVPFAAEFLGVFGKGYKGLPPITEEDARWEKLAKEQAVEQEFEQSMFKGNADCIYSYKYSYSSSRVLCFVTCVDSLGILPLIPSVFNKVSSFDETEFSNNFIHTFSLELLTIDRVGNRWISNLATLVEVALLVYSITNPAYLLYTLATKALTEYVIPKVVEYVVKANVDDPIQAKAWVVGITTGISILTSSYKSFDKWDKIDNLTKILSVSEIGISAYSLYENIKLHQKRRRERNRQNFDSIQHRYIERKMLANNKKLNELLLADTKLLASELSKLVSMSSRLYSSYITPDFVNKTFDYLSKSSDTNRKLIL